jgi:carbamoylphosphate synthase large subunit
LRTNHQVAAELGLPGNPVSAYENAKDKFGTRRALAKAGLATPAAVQVSVPIWLLVDFNSLEMKYL